MDLDPKKIGLKVGIEVHQQLATGKKLFCECPIVKSEEFPYSFRRRLRPAQSELGRVDPAAVFEFSKGKVNAYMWSPESSCLVEADEEPPHPINEEAVGSTIVIATLLGSKPMDEIHVMRKIVIDGSNTTGFQRTAIIGIGGSVEMGEGTVGVQSVTLEEDAARILGEDEGERRYGLDRLGTPLVEVSLDPFTGTPEEVGELALRVGRALRSTGRVARGLGTIRQDLNVSVKGGRVVEVKGVQRLNLVQKVVAYEASRQLALVEVAERLRGKRGGVRCTTFDASSRLSRTASPAIKKQLAKGGKVVCISATNLSGLLGWEPFPGVRLGREVAEVARANGLGGIIHSDEFTKQGVTAEEEAALRGACRAPHGSALVLVAGDPAVVDRAIPPIVCRLELTPEGVPAETRGATDDGETKYMRPRPGAQRMYPETDIPDFVVTSEVIRNAARSIPERWETKVKRYQGKFGLSEDLAQRLYDSGYSELFERLAGENLAPSVLAATLVDVPSRLVRDGVAEDRVTDALLVSLVKAMAAGRVAKEAVYDVALHVGSGKADTVEAAIGILGLGALSRVSVEREIARVLSENAGLISERGEGAFSVLMGVVMERVRGKADGKLVSDLLRERLRLLTNRS
jgi:glutamyl-tRNA(Gln) amidotransferase subunit E